MHLLTYNRNSWMSYNMQEASNTKDMHLTPKNPSISASEQPPAALQMEQACSTIKLCAPPHAAHGEYNCKQ